MSEHPLTRHPDKLQMEGYLLGHLAPGMRETFERHLRECAACRSTVDVMKTEITSLSSFLGNSSIAGPEPCLTDWELTAFLDLRINRTERSRFNQHLSTCGICRKNLLQLHEEMLDIQDMASKHDVGATPGLEAPVSSQRVLKRDEQTTNTAKDEERNAGERKISEH